MKYKNVEIGDKPTKEQFQEYVFAYTFAWHFACVFA